MLRGEVPTLKQGDDLLRWQGFGPKVPLREVAAHPAKRHELICSLDALGDGVETERVGEVDRRSDDRRLDAVRSDAGDEPAVELEGIHTVLAQAEQ